MCKRENTTCQIIQNEIDVFSKWNVSYIHYIFWVSEVLVRHITYVPLIRNLRNPCIDYVTTEIVR